MDDAELGRFFSRLRLCRLVSVSFMSDSNEIPPSDDSGDSNPGDGNSGEGNPDGNPGTPANDGSAGGTGDATHLTGQVRAQHVSARVPEGISRGVFSTGVILITGASEFVVDFIQNLGQPVQVVSRVVVPHSAMPQFIDALRKNLEIYSQRYGAPQMPPNPADQQPQRRMGVQEIYDELKIPDELLSGVYANGLMIGHTATEFRLDFLTNLFPHSAVSSRVFLSAPQIPRMIDSLHATFQALQQRLLEQRQQQTPDEENPDEENPDEENPDEENPDEENPGEENPGEENPGEDL